MTSSFDAKFKKTLFSAAMLAVTMVVPAAAQMPASSVEGPEFPVETAAIVAATARLFESAESGNRGAAPRVVISRPNLARPASLTRKTGNADVLTARGPVDHLTGYRISWYPVDRFLGSVDFMGTWDRNRNLICGFVTWDLSDAARPKLVDVTASFVDIADLSRQSDEAIHAALLDANCAYGAIEANYAFFE